MLPTPVDRFVLQSAAKGEVLFTSELAHESRHFSGYLGAAYLDPIKCVIRVVEDTLETSRFDSMNMRRSTNNCSGNTGELTCASPGTGGARLDPNYEKNG